MNRNHHIKTAAVALSAGMIISAAPAVEASPLAGAVATMYNVQETLLLEKSALSGTSLALSNMLEVAAVNDTESTNISSVMTTDIANEILEAKADAVEEKAAEPVLEVVEEATTEPNVSEPVNIGAGVTALVAEASIKAVEVETQAQVEAEAEQQTASEFENIAIANVNDYVNIRSEASEESDAVGKLYANGAATVQEVEGDWIHITSGNADGYIKAEFLEVGNEELCLENSKIIAKVTTDGLNVREETNTESSILERKEEGDRLDVAEDDSEDAEWVKVDLGEGEGYVSAEFVEVGRIYSSVAETKEEEEARLEAERKEAERQAAAAAAKSSKGGAKAAGGGYAPPAGAGGQAVANFACQFIGNPYVYGGASLTGGADCSGFVMAVYSNFGVGLPHSSGAMRGVGYGVDPSQMAPGDILCYSGHVGIYVGGGVMVNASTPATGIKYTNVNYKPLLAVRRVM